MFVNVSKMWPSRSKYGWCYCESEKQTENVYLILYFLGWNYKFIEVTLCDFSWTSCHEAGRRIQICLDILCFYSWLLLRWVIVSHLLKKDCNFTSQKNNINLHIEVIENWPESERTSFVQAAAVTRRAGNKSRFPQSATSAKNANYTDTNLLVHVCCHHKFH